MADPKSSRIHIVMFPWFAMGHLAPFLNLSNQLAQRGCSITFLLPMKAIKLLRDLNLYPDFITFHPLTVPQVNGLPVGTETASDIPIHMCNLLCVAFDRTRDQVDRVIRSTQPKLVVYDFAYWVPEIAKPLGIKSLSYSVVHAVVIALIMTDLNISLDMPISEAEKVIPPPGYPSSTLTLRGPEAKSFTTLLSLPFGEGVTFYERLTMASKECDAIGIRTCQEVEGKFCDYIGSLSGNKKVLLTGPVLTEEFTNKPLDDKWNKWLNKFEPDSVIFCVFGSQVILEKNQFQEILFGFEQTGLPFLVAVKPPNGTLTVEEALPEGFAERVKGRGMVEGGWVPQVEILNHPSIGCFVSHSGSSSFWEALMSKAQIVLVPHTPDQIVTTRLLCKELMVATEVETDENRWITKENLCESSKFVMDKDDEQACLLRSNHMKWREILSSPGFMSNYIDKFVKDIKELVG